jgi:hypothetical protein
METRVPVVSTGTGRRGQSLAEAAIILPCLVAILGSVTLIVMLWFETVWAQNIAYESALCGLEHNRTDECWEEKRQWDQRTLVLRRITSLRISLNHEAATSTLRLERASHLTGAPWEFFLPPLQIDHSIALRDFRGRREWR